MESLQISLIKANPNNPRLIPIQGCEQIYFAGSDGFIYSKNGKWNSSLRILKPGTDGCGYQIVTLCINKQRRTKTVHRLIMSAFFGESDKQVNHKDGKKANNSIENLEYVSAKENIRHAIDNGLAKYNTTEIAEKKRKKVLQVDLSGRIVNEFVSAHNAAKLTGFNRGNISTACRTGVKFYNHKWEYAKSKD